MFLVTFPVVVKLGNICFGRKICVREAKFFLTPSKNIFCFRAAKFVSATHVSRAAKLGNICIRNNVSVTMLPILARPLREAVAKSSVVLMSKVVKIINVEMDYLRIHKAEIVEVITHAFGLLR